MHRLQLISPSSVRLASHSALTGAPARFAAQDEAVSTQKAEPLHSRIERAIVFNPRVWVATFVLFCITLTGAMMGYNRSKHLQISEVTLKNGQKAKIKHDNAIVSDLNQIQLFIEEGAFKAVSEGTFRLKGQPVKGLIFTTTHDNKVFLPATTKGYVGVLFTLIKARQNQSLKFTTEFFTEPTEQRVPREFRSVGQKGKTLPDANADGVVK